MADAISPATGRCYGIACVCRVWEVPRSSFYAARQAGADDAGARSSPARRGPKPAVSDADLLAAAWFRICCFRVTRACEERRLVRAGFRLAMCRVREAARLAVVRPAGAEAVPGPAG